MILSSVTCADSTDDIVTSFLRYAKDNEQSIPNARQRARTFLRTKDLAFSIENTEVVVSKLVRIEYSLREFNAAKKDLATSKLLSTQMPSADLYAQADNAVRYFMGMSSTDLSLEIEHLIRAMVTTITDTRTLQNVIAAFTVLKQVSWFDLNTAEPMGNTKALRQSMASQGQELTADSVLIDLNQLQTFLAMEQSGNDYIKIIGFSRCGSHGYKIIVYPSSFDLYVRHNTLPLVGFQNSDRITMYHLKHKTE